MAFQSLEEMIQTAEEKKIALWKAIQLEDVSEGKETEESSYETMKSMWEAILSASESYDEKLLSNSKLVGGDGGKLTRYRESGKSIPLCGDYISHVMEQAVQMGESNACMKRIVAAPTAGSCGVLPAVLVPYKKLINDDHDRLIESLYIAAGIGQVIVHRASISGAEGGCQAEIGSASAMAAGALCYLQGGNHKQIIHAAAMAMKNLLGLVCDPVAGLVEVPCVKRNVIGAVNAVTSAEMALAGIESKIPPDQVFDAMKEVGDKMDVSLRETGKGGLAATPFALRLEEEASLE